MNAGDFDPRDLRARTPVVGVELHDVLGSTNDRARELAEQAVGPLPQLIVARRQTRGRGRGGNRWWSAEGSLTFSLLIQRFVSPSPDVPEAILSPVTALAVADAVQDWVPQSTVRLKWPNDVFLGQRKLCGILIESTLRPTPKTIVGIGLNVNNRLVAASPSLDQPATSLIETLGHPLSLQDVLVSLVRTIFEGVRPVCERAVAGVLALESVLPADRSHGLRPDGPGRCGGRVSGDRRSAAGCVWKRLRDFASATAERWSGSCQRVPYRECFFQGCP